jgi:Ca2+-dependent lipid-binding protein
MSKLRVNIFSAKKLIKPDSSDSYNGYIELKFQSNTKETKTVENTLEPEWNEGN